MGRVSAIEGRIPKMDPKIEISAKNRPLPISKCHEPLWRSKLWRKLQCVFCFNIATAIFSFFLPNRSGEFQFVFLRSSIAL